MYSDDCYKNVFLTIMIIESSVFFYNDIRLYFNNILTLLLHIG